MMVLPKCFPPHDPSAAFSMIGQLLRKRVGIDTSVLARHSYLGCVCQIYFSEDRSKESHGPTLPAQWLVNAVTQQSLKHLMIAVLLLSGSPLSAQEASSQPKPDRSQETNQANALPQSPNKQSLLRQFTYDEYRLWTSPFRKSNYDSHTLRKYGLPFLLISGALIATDHKTADLLPNTADQTVWSGRVSQLGAAYTLAAMSGSTYLIGKWRSDSHMKEAGILSLEALGHAQLFALGIKAITQRERPLDPNPSGTGFWKGGDAFPSGHSASSFAVASVFAYEYRDHIAVPITAYSLASLISVSRLSARRHWASDIFVGGSLGFLLGRYVYKHHHDPTLPGSPGYRTSRLMPDIAFGNRRAVLCWTF